jgi:hypothetical protein
MLTNRHVVLCAFTLLCGSCCFGSDNWCSSATFTIGAGDSEPGGHPFGKRFVQFFDISTQLVPSEQAKKEKLDTVTVNLVVLIVRTETDALEHTKDYEETLHLRIPRVQFGGFQSRISQDFGQLTTGIKRIYTKSIVCESSRL